MKAGNYGYAFVGIDYEHQRIGKAAQQGAPDVLVHHGKLGGMGADALDRYLDGKTREAPQSRGLFLIPNLRFKEFPPRRLA